MTETKFQIGDKVEELGQVAPIGEIVDRYKGKDKDYFRVKFPYETIWLPASRLVKLLVVTLLLAVGGSAASTKEIKSTYVSDHAVLVACKDGKVPQGNYVSGALLVSCR